MIRQRQRRSLRLISCLLAVLVLASTASKAHPHDEQDIFEVKGILTRVDLGEPDRRGGYVRQQNQNDSKVLFFVDRKIKIRNGRTRMDLAQLEGGQRVICTVERQHQEGREDCERLTQPEEPSNQQLSATPAVNNFAC